MTNKERIAYNAACAALHQLITLEQLCADAGINGDEPMDDITQARNYLRHLIVTIESK